jgi:RecT family
MASKRKPAAAIRRRAARRKPAAAMVVHAPDPKPWLLSLDEVALVKNHIAKGATDEELKFCLAVARRFKLDPFRQQIWFVKRRDKTADGGYRWIPITGINGLLHIAARDHKDFGSNDEPEFGPLHQVKWEYYETKGTLQAPEWARVKVWKKGHEHPIVATVYWDEVYPDVGAAPLVRQMPRLMLGKCALAQAIRRAYPATDGLYVKEEFQGPSDLTPGGRVIETTPQLSEAEKNWEKREAEGMENLTKEQREVAKSKVTPQPLKVRIVKFPEKETGDVELICNMRTAQTLKLVRPGPATDCWLIKVSSLVKFHDLCREQGVEVEDGTNAERPE